MRRSLTRGWLDRHCSWSALRRSSAKFAAECCRAGPVSGPSCFPLGKWLAPGDELAAHLFREAIWWALGAGALAWVLLVERLPLISIGLRRIRGYAIERLTALTGRRTSAAVISAVVFIAVHIGSWGYAQLVVVAFGALILTLLYVWRRNLGTNMIAHFLTDFIGFMLARLQGA